MKRLGYVAMVISLWALAIYRLTILDMGGASLSLLVSCIPLVFAFKDDNPTPTTAWWEDVHVMD